MGLERIDEAEEKKLRQWIQGVLEERFKEMEFEEFLEDTAEFVMDLRERVVELEEEVYD